MSARARLRTALVLDDEPERQTEMCRGLLDHGVRSVGAATVAEAIRQLASTRYDLVVCDMILCDPPGAANPALRGYLAVCCALSRPGVVAVQASSLRRLAHPGAVLTNWRVEEVADVVYGWAGIPGHQSEDGGCPWSALEQLPATGSSRRPRAVRELRGLPAVRDLEGPAGLYAALDGLEDAAEGGADWEAAVAIAWRAFFPGSRHAG